MENGVCNNREKLIEAIDKINGIPAHICELL